MKRILDGEPKSFKQAVERISNIKQKVYKQEKIHTSVLKLYFHRKETFNRGQSVGDPIGVVP